MSQSKSSSLLEVSVTTLASYLVSVIVGQLWVYPMFGYTLTLGDNMGLTAVFVSISMVIKYGLRRLFNYLQDPGTVVYQYFLRELRKARGEI